MTPALFLDDITCTFVSKDDRSQRYTAVANTTLAIAPGEFVSVVGPTGCGKSTLLNVGAGLLQPSSGSVKVFGEELNGINSRAGYMFQAEALMPWRSALENVIAGLQYRGVEAAQAREMGEQWLARVGLKGFGDTTFFTLNFPAEIYSHLLVTLTETVLAFGIGTVLGLGVGLWLALSPLTSAILDPYVKAANSMPRVILAPIFAMWFGLGIWSKVALAVTLVFFIVFFNVYQGVKEVSPMVLANARMLGANARQLLRTVYLPSATSWVFSSLHTSIGLAFVGAVVGEYLGSARGVGYLILQAEGSFDINTVFAGIVVLTAFALVLDLAVGAIEKRLMKWQPKSGETEKL